MQEEVSTSIVKADRLGRTHYSSEYKAQVLEAFQKSSLSGQAFARQCGIKYPTFASWVTKRKRETAPARSGDPAPAFLVAELPGASGSSVLEVSLPGGSLARIASSSQIPLLAELLKALA